MKKIVLIPLVIIVVGIVFASAGYAAGGPKGVWVDRNGLHVSDRGELIKVSESYNSFKSISVDAAFLDQIILTEGAGYTVRGQNYEAWGGLEVELIGDTLTILANNRNDWSIGWGTGELFRGREDAWVEITYPGTAILDDVDVKLSAGEARVNGIACVSLVVDNSFGDIEVQSVRCDSLRIAANAGRIELDDANVTGEMVLDNSFGDVELSDIKADALTATLDSGRMDAETIDAKSVSISNNFGEVKINTAEAEKMEIQLSSGSLKVDNTKTGDMKVRNSFGDISIDRFEFTGVCEIESMSGDVTLGLRMAEYDISYTLNVSMGEIWVGETKTRGTYTNRNSEASADLRVDSDFGSIHVKFVQ